MCCCCRPFCSLYNTLKLELVAMSTVRENDAQFTFNANTGEAAACCSSSRVVQCVLCHALHSTSQFIKQQLLTVKGRQQ